MLRALTTALLVLAVGCDRSQTDGAPSASAPAASVAAVADVAPPLSVGQWAHYRVQRADGSTSKIAYEVVGAEGAAHWIEVASGEGASGTVIQLLITLPDRARPESSDILAVKMRLPDGQVHERRGEELSGTKQAYAANIREIFPPPSPAGPRTDLTVPAGTFRGCSQRETSFEVDGEKKTRTVWTHPSVPITSMVQSKAQDGDEVSLTGHGLTGAKSDI